MKKKKGYKWSFRKMHISMQILLFSLGAIATWGYVIGGMWLLSIVMGY